jgi:signal transduction histidine kinase
VDRSVAAAFALPAAAILLNEAERAWEGVLAMGAFVLVVGAVAERRRWPVAALVGQIAAVAVLDLAEPRAVVVALCALGYTLYLPASVLPLRTAVVALVAAVLAVLSTALPDFSRPGGAVVFVFAYVVIWLLGVGVAMNRRYTARLLAQQVELSAAEVHHARGLVMEERLRIARDLHDVVAHGISVIAVQAAYGGLVIEQNPERAGDALAAIESVSRQTLGEMRQLLRVLRRSENEHGQDGDERLAPAPGLSDLDRLVSEAGRVIPEVQLTVLGTPRPLPAGIETAAYRTVQEALTNAVRHAGAQQVRVVLRYSGDQVDIEVTDDGRGFSADPGPGYGIVGMRERALLYGGTLHAGRRDGGGFRVASSLPVDQEAGDQQGASAEPVTAEPLS